jgi:hypothetical protein
MILHVGTSGSLPTLAVLDKDHRSLPPSPSHSTSVFSHPSASPKLNRFPCRKRVMAKDGVIESGGEFAVKDYTDPPPAPLIDAA